MYRRLFFGIIATMLFARAGFADTVADLMRITYDSKCDEDTLGVTEGIVEIDANWLPNAYTCEQGKYLDSQTIQCEICKTGSYCAGFENQTFNDTDMGLSSCAEKDADFPYSDAGAIADTQCYQIGTLNCADLKPYTGGNGTATYANETVGCRTYSGTDVCIKNIDVDIATDCNILSLNCNDGYIQDTVENELKCSQIICAAGNYLPSGSKECQICPEDHYCAGGALEQGKEACAEGYESVAGSTAETQCYKPETVECATLKPYTGGNGTATYANETVACKTYFGSDSCEPNEDVDVEAACKITSLNCADGYIEDTVDGELKCVQITCGAGEYLPTGSKECQICPEDHYCAGGTVEQGKEACAEGYKSAAGSTAETQCYKPGTLACATLNPYSVENGTPKYANETVACKTYFGSTECEKAEDVDVETACKIVSLDCESGYIEDTVDGEQKCVQITCGAGEYLPSGSKECKTCLADHYCKGGTYGYDEEEDHGMSACAEGYKSAAGSTAKTQCYKPGTLACTDLNPYSVENGTPKYANETIACKTYFGSTECEKAEDVDVETACKIVSLNCESGYFEDVVDGELRCVQITCAAGEYLPSGSKECKTCLEDNYCEGGTFVYDAEMAQGMNKCSGNLHSPSGAHSEKDCGYIWHIGDTDKLYLHKDKRTSPTFVVEIDGEKWYANITPVADGVKPISPDTTESAHIEIDGVEYTIHTSILD